MKGRKEVSVNVSNRKSITRMMTGTKDTREVLVIFKKPSTKCHIKELYLN